MSILAYFAKFAAETIAERSLTRLLTVKARFLRCKVWRRNNDMRVTYSAFLRLCVDDQYLLIRNLHRKGIYAPIGGVFKRTPESRAVLDNIEFRPQVFKKEMNADLRGFVPRRNISKFDKWFKSGEDRESTPECIRRELAEELAEIDLHLDITYSELRFRRVRVVSEGPAPVDQQPYVQYRHFEFYDLSSLDGASGRLLERMLELGRAHEGLLVASSDEIVRGRARDGRQIAHHAVYLFRSKGVNRDEPLYFSP